MPRLGEGWYDTGLSSRVHHVALLNDTDLKSRPVPVIVSRSDHNISRANISPNALKVLYRLRGAGFAAFLLHSLYQSDILKSIDVADLASFVSIK